VFPIRIGSGSFLPAALYRLDYQVRKPKVDLYGKKNLKRKKTKNKSETAPENSPRLRENMGDLLSCKISDFSSVFHLISRYQLTLKVKVKVGTVPGYLFSSF
jgi:hypothetical protein